MALHARTCKYYSVTLPVATPQRKNIIACNPAAAKKLDGRNKSSSHQSTAQAWPIHFPSRPASWRRTLQPVRRPAFPMNMIALQKVFVLTKLCALCILQGNLVGHFSAAFTFMSDTSAKHKWSVTCHTSA